MKTVAPIEATDGYDLMGKGERQRFPAKIYFGEASQYDAAHGLDELRAAPETRIKRFRVRVGTPRRLTGYPGHSGLWHGVRPAR